MPKSKPTQVIVHRIELQDKEREILQAVVAGKTIEGIGKGVYYVVIAGATAATAYVVWWTADTIWGWKDKVGDWWATLKARMEEPVTSGTFAKDPDRKGYSKDGTPLNIFGLPGWGVIPGWL